MSLEGTASPLKQMKGNINRFTTYHTDAYMIAVRNGFKGTESWECPHYTNLLNAEERLKMRSIASSVVTSCIGLVTSL